MRTKTLGIGAALFGLAMMLTLTSKTTQAFHSGGVAECSGCHSMHQPKANGDYLLVGTDASSTCLTCHQHAGDTGPNGYHISTDPSNMPAGTAPLQRTPGGDFGWLKKNYTFSVRGTTTNELGDSHGHNIVAADNGYTVDATNASAPGGASFASSNLGCTSCHDPHSSIRRDSTGAYVKPVNGQAGAPIIASGSYNNTVAPAAGQAVGVYRLLRGLGEKDPSGSVTFNGVAIAIAPSTYNQTEVTNQVRVAYGATGTNTWSNWCATCHPNMHSSGNYVHPIDQSLGSAVANIYNAYVKSGDLSGTSATSFNSLVPFADNTGDIPTLQSHSKNDNTYLNGPQSSDKVTCLSCHRAHASGWPEMLRWNMENEFMVFNSLYTGKTEVGRGRTETEAAGAYYDRPATVFASYQRGLCNKCHAKD